MKPNKPWMPIACIAILCSICVVLTGCGQLSSTPQAQPTTQSAAPSPSPTIQAATEAPVATEQPNTGPKLNMLDVVYLESINTNLIITGVDEISKADGILGVGQKIISPWIFVKNIGTETVSVSYSPFILVDKEGTEYEASNYTPGNYYGGVKLLPGGIIEGPVYFIVPDQTEAYSLKAMTDLAWTTLNPVEIDLQQYSADPSEENFSAEYIEYFKDVQLVEFNTAHHYGDVLSLQVTGADFITTDQKQCCESFRFYQVELTVENLTDEEMHVTLDYSYMLYSPSYNHLVKQIPLPFADNEMWVETLAPKESKAFVITFEAKGDSAENLLFVQDFFQEHEPVFFKLDPGA